MAITLDGTTGISSPGGDTSTSLATTNLSYTGTLTGGTGVIAIGTNQIYKDASGNVGLGVTPSAWTLGRAIQISQSASFNGQYAVNAAYMNANAYYGSGGWTYINNDLATSYRQYNGTHGWFSAAAGTGAISTFATPTMTLDASGNLGIGTTSPSKKLEIFASANSLQIESVVRNDQAGSGVAAIGFNVSSSAAGDTSSTKAGIGLVRQNTYGVGSLCFYNSATTSAGDFTTADERARIDSSGNLVIGGTASYGRFTVYPATTPTTTAGANQIWIGEATLNSSYRLQVGYANYSGAYKGTIQTYTGGVASDLVVCGDGGSLLVGTTTQASNAKVTVFSDNTTGGGVAVASSASLYRQMYLTSTGTVLQFWNGTNQASLSAAGAWTNASDARLKKDIVDIKYGLSTVLASEPRSFNRVDTDGEYIGFIAQELKKLVPEVVFGSDAEGDQYTVDYGSLVAVAFKAIQELTTRLEALESKK